MKIIIPKNNEMKDSVLSSQNHELFNYTGSAQQRL
jgi:hypothetical protein